MSLYDKTIDEQIGVSLEKTNRREDALIHVMKIGSSIQSYYLCHRFSDLITVNIHFHFVARETRDVFCVIAT